MTSFPTVTLSPGHRTLLLKSGEQGQEVKAANTKVHPRGSTGAENGSVYFIGNATTLIEWEGLRLMTDPNFLHAGDHVHLGPGVVAERLKNPAVELSDLPPLDGIFLSHYHADHFDHEVEEALNRDFMIITTPHAKKCLASKHEPFRNVIALDFFDNMKLNIDESLSDEELGTPTIKATAMPGKHVPPGALDTLNHIIKAVPPTNGWMLELGYEKLQSTDTWKANYRIYISGDTLMVDELKDIPKWLRNERIDLMLIHLGGTTLPGPKAPLIMVTMDAKQGVEMMQLMNPDVTIPIHFDDYSVFMSPLSDFEEGVKNAGLDGKVVYLDRGDKYRFTVAGQ